jgi:hypothetical protein
MRNKSIAEEKALDDTLLLKLISDELRVETLSRP